MTSERTHYKQLIDTSYLGQWDFPPGRKATVTIESVKRYKPARARKVKRDDGTFGPEPAKRLEIRFRGKRKPWLAGPVSQSAIAGMFGPIIQDWIGKSITLYVDESVMLGRARVGGVRVEPVAATGPETEDALDRIVDEGKAELIASFFEEGEVT